MHTQKWWQSQAHTLAAQLELDRPALLAVSVTVMALPRSAPLNADGMTASIAPCSTLLDAQIDVGSTAATHPGPRLSFTTWDRWPGCWDRQTELHLLTDRASAPGTDGGMFRQTDRASPPGTDARNVETDRQTELHRLTDRASPTGTGARDVVTDRQSFASWQTELRPLEPMAGCWDRQAELHHLGPARGML
jgi:hypothetical protein